MQTAADQPEPAGGPQQGPLHGQHERVCQTGKLCTVQYSIPVLTSPVLGMLRSRPPLLAAPAPVYFCASAIATIL